MNCNFVTGYVDLDFDNFDVTVASCVFNDGYVKMRYGRVIGNDITTVNNYYTPSSYYRTSIYVGTDVTPTNDSISIVGNKISNNNPSSYYNNGIYGSTTSQYYYIENNYITTSENYYLFGISIISSKNSSLGRNSIINNTVSGPLVTYFHGIEEVSSSANAYFDILNNLLLAQAGSGINVSSSGGPLQVSYNLMNNPLTFSGITDDGTNNLSSNTTLDLTGHPNGGTDAINGGSPDEAYYDINLTRNDAGAFGGSFTLDNFYPVTGAARVYFVRAPRKVTLGSTLNVKGDAFDR